MLEKQTINTGVRLTKAQAAKLDLLATNLQISRNRVFGVLLDSAEVQTAPSVSVKLRKHTPRTNESENCVV